MHFEEYIMNDNLRKLVLQAGAPEEVMEEMWFHVFCQQFTDLIISEMENENVNA